MIATQLADDLLNGNDQQRSAAAQTLAAMGPEAAPAAVALVTLVDDKAAGEWCVAALEELGPPPADDVATLAGYCATASEQPAYWSATLLGRLEGAAAAAVPQLVEAATSHAAPSVRERAVWALGKIGPFAAQSRPALEQIASSESGRIARLAKQALKEIQRDSG